MGLESAKAFLANDCVYVVGTKIVRFTSRVTAENVTSLCHVNIFYENNTVMI